MIYSEMLLKMEKYRPSVSQKNVNAAPLKWNLKKKKPEIFRLN